MQIGRYREGDAEALWNVFFSAIHQVAAADYTPKQINAWAPPNVDLPKWTERMRGLAPFVVERAGQIVGYADVQPNGYIDHFFVSGGATRQGVGSLLMQEIHEAALAQATKSLFSEVSITARPFFEHWGFEVEQAQTISIRGVSLENFRMRKSGLTSAWSRRGRRPC